MCKGAPPLQRQRMSRAAAAREGAPPGQQRARAAAAHEGAAPGQQRATMSLDSLTTWAEVLANHGGTTFRVLADGRRQCPTCGLQDRVVSRLQAAICAQTPLSQDGLIRRKQQMFISFLRKGCAGGDRAADYLNRTLWS